MNIAFWLVVLILFVIVFIIIIPPLWKNREIKESASDQRNIDIAQERVTDLKQQLAAGVLSQEQFDEQYGELELTLGDDLDIETRQQTDSTQGRWMAPIILLAVPVFSVMTYFLLGDPDALIKADLQPAQAAQQQASPDVNAMVAGLAKRLQDDPDNAKGWLMLGRSYKYLQKPQLAVNAFEKAYALLGEDPEVMLHYADALAMASGGRLVGKAAELVFKAIEKSPNDVMGLWLAGMAKAEIGEKQQAMQYWRKLEALLPADSDSLKELQRMMATLNLPTANSTEPKLTKELISITVQVSVKQAIKDQVNDNDVVFIYAKALAGSPMPLAIVRKQVSDLPTTVTLNDAMAMMPAMKLSNFTQVKVMARISKSGTAMQQKGDFIGSLELTDLAGNQSAIIVINEQI